MKISGNFASEQEKYFDTISTSHGKSGLLKESRALTLELGVIMKAMGDLTGKKVLDIGCGSGRHAIRIAKVASQVTGIDISKKSIDLANQAAAETGVMNFKGVVGDYSHPTQSKYFDVALMVNVVHHIDDIAVVLQSARESLNENGKIVILEFNPLNILFIPFLVFHRQTKAHFNTKYFRSNIWSLKKSLRENGFDIVTVEKYAYLPTALYNYSVFFQKINSLLNAIPIVSLFSAFHIITCRKSA